MNYAQQLNDLCDDLEDESPATMAECRSELTDIGDQADCRIKELEVQLANLSIWAAERLTEAGETIAKLQESK